MLKYLSIVCALGLAGCGAGRSNNSGGGGGDGGLSLDYDGSTSSGSDGGQVGCGAQPKGCYTVYAHGDHELYRIDLMAKTLVTVGAFNAPMIPSGTKMVEDTITDLAVSPTDVIYAISHTNLYTADAADGHVTLVGAVTACGTLAVALSFTPDGKLYTADFKGALCEIDITANPPAIVSTLTLGSGLALSGDLVAVGDGTMYGTAYKLTDTSTTSGTQADNLLVKIDPKTGAILQQVGSTGFPKLFGAAFALGQVFGFSHDGSGDVVTIDPLTGKGTLFNTFLDPATSKGISFAGAAVNADVSPIQ